MIWTPVAAGIGALFCKNMQLICNLVPCWGGYGLTWNLTILVNDKIILSKLGLRDLFHPFVKTSIYSIFHLTPILFRGGHFLSCDILIMKNADIKKDIISQAFFL